MKIAVALAVLLFGCQAGPHFVSACCPIERAPDGGCDPLWFSFRLEAAGGAVSVDYCTPCSAVDALKLVTDPKAQPLVCKE